MFAADLHKLQSGRKRGKDGILSRVRSLMQTCVQEISRVGYKLTCMPHPSAERKKMMRYISYSIAFCIVAAITASGVKAEELADARDYGGQTAIGTAAVTVNKVKGTIETNIVNINNNDRVFQEEIIETDSNSTTQILFLDETVLTIGPESKLVLDEMVFDPNVTTGKVVMNAVKGLFTFVSGSLPSESYEINTPTTSIAVRGTRFDLFVSRKGASTVILRRGAIDVKNRVAGVTRRISKKGLATRVNTKRSNPTLPAPPSPELERLFKPLSDPRELQGKSLGKTNVARESVEEESSKQRKQALLELGVEDEPVSPGTVTFSGATLNPVKTPPSTEPENLDVVDDERVKTTKTGQVIRLDPSEVDLIAPTRQPTGAIESIKPTSALKSIPSAGFAKAAVAKKVSGVAKKASAEARKASASAKKASGVAKKASAEARKASAEARKAAASAKKSIRMASASAKKIVKKVQKSANNTQRSSIKQRQFKRRPKK